MRQLILLYWGCVFLMYLSQVYYPTSAQLEGPQTGRWHFMLRKADIFMIVVIVWMTCFSFLRTSYNDTWNYIYAWNSSDGARAFLESGGLLDLTGNPLSNLWREISHDISNNYHIYFFPPALLSSFAAVKLLKKYSVDPAFSMLIFFSLGTYITYVAALKQCFAIFFLLLSIPYAIDRKYIRFYLLVFLAILFHTHAFMFAIVPLLFGKPWGKTSIGFLLAAFFAMATYDATLGAFMEYAQSIGALVAEIEVFDNNPINILRVIVYWIPALLALAFRKRLFSNSTRTENLFVNMSMVSAFILMIGLIQAANLFARMAAYFEIATAISLPWMIKKLFTKRSARAVTICAAILYFGYFLYEFGVSKDFGNDYSAITLWQFVTDLFGG